MKFAQRAQAKGAGVPRIASVQNCYNLLCRTFDSTLAECCHREKISLLAYSPLAMGHLSGKYLGEGLDAAGMAFDCYSRMKMWCTLVSFRSLVTCVVHWIFFGLMHPQ